MIKRKILLYSNLGAYPANNYRTGLLNTLKRDARFQVEHVKCHVESFRGVYNQFKPDIVLSVKGWIPKDINHGNCKFIQLFPDDPDKVDEACKHVPEFDYWFTNSFEAVTLYNNNGFRDVFVCGFATDEKFTENIEQKDEFKCDIMFAGGDGQKKYRYKYLNALKGLDVRVYGKWSKDVYGNQHRVLRGQEYFEAIKSAKIAIDFNVSGSGFFNVKTKSFEIPASKGAMMLCDQFEEMALYYDYTCEVAGFTTPEDLRIKCEYFLKHESERKKFVERAYERFMNEHTWKKRLDFIFKKCRI